MCALHRCRVRLWFALALLLGGAVWNPALAQSASATNVVLLLALEGRVEIARASSVRWDPARTNQVLDPGDRIRTGQDSRATLRMFDLSVMRMDQETVLELEAPPEAEPSIFLHLVRGVLYLFHRDKPGSVRFRSRSASAATRGTELNIAVDDNGRMTLTMLEGQAELSNESGRIVLSSGQQAVAEPGRPPVDSRVLYAVSIIQWCLHYPGVLYVEESGLDANTRAELQDSLEAYRAGDLPRALRAYPQNRRPASASESLYLAALRLSAGRVDEAKTLLDALPKSNGDQRGRLARALELLIAAVQGRPLDLDFETWVEPGEEPSSPLTSPPGLTRATPLVTEWLAASYAYQSRFQLDHALRAARASVRVAPPFGWGWVRVAELEFSIGRSEAALEALDRGLALCPRHAEALALRGFVLAARNRMAEGMASFEEAMAIDPSLANAWLGRGLCRIRLGQTVAGRDDLQVAVALEPQRALLRSYLGKAYDQEKDLARARHELELAKTSDPADPTAWFYSALLYQENNRINQAVRDLEQSIERNDNQRLYRSRLRLDQDRAVRGANLANMYLDAGMIDVSVREATRAVNADYANDSAHLFLANSFDRLRDPNQVNLRFETAWFSEYLLANLLAPVGAGTVSQLASRQEFSPFFERDRLGLVSSTEYFSNGDWLEEASQFGRYGNTSYALDATYRNQNGTRPNNETEQQTYSLQLKHQLGLQDSVFFQTILYDANSGDLNQYYDQDDANPRFRFEEEQQPLLLAGYHHEWNPAHHTLALASRLEDTVRIHNPQQPELALFKTNGQVALVPVPAAALGTNRYRDDFEAYSMELQHIWHQDRHSVVAGGRFQTGDLETRSSRMSNNVPLLLINPLGGVLVAPPPPSGSHKVDTDFYRMSFYGYYHWQVVEPLQLSAGLSYDRLKYPVNILNPPVDEEEDTKDQVSPKAGFTWQPDPLSTVRGAYTRSLGGVSLDQSFRLEPVQVAGFNQAFRSLIPESVSGTVPAEEYETFGLAADRRFSTGTYLAVDGQWLRSDTDRHLGVNDLTSTFPPLQFQYTPGHTKQRLEFDERTLWFTFHQLISESWSFGTLYRLSHASLETRLKNVPASTVTAGNLSVSTDEDAILHQVNLFALYYHPRGFFGRIDAWWNQQSNQGYSTDIPGDDFWQLDVLAGYRFPRRRAEIRVGLLNVTDQDYRLNPLNLTTQRPRDRTFTASFRFQF